jgi:hypothetical protein
MSCDCGGGENRIAALSLPPSDNTDGPITDVVAFTANKSVELTGNYEGQFIIMGSHDGTRFVPLITFNSGSGVNAFKQTLKVTPRYLRVRRRAFISSVSAINIGGKSTCICQESD